MLKTQKVSLVSFLQTNLIQKCPQRQVAKVKLSLIIDKS